ncbi:U32 family peptidase [Candidatus Woesearchaeota archaeon]|nr:U32 family peptidase [Candidatus Woesearchaeota archaeon]
MISKKIEIMAPAGSYESLRAAINAGADSIYFGVEQMNMRSRSANFMLDDLPKIVEICKDNNVKSYLTVNTIVYDHDMNMVKRICDAAKKAELTAVICMDIAAIQYARSIGLEVHISTQINVSNIEAVKFYSQFADVVVLARELTLKQITTICEEIKKQDIRGPKGKLVEIEIFVHGALCIAISGKCHMSLSTYNASANRGACLQNCRRAYKVIDEETGDELKIDNKFVMSPSDLCTLPFLDKILDSGVSVLKIEGRGRSPDYADETVKCYKEAVKAIKNNEFTKEKIENWMKRLKSVYNRGFWEGGYYLGKKINEWAGVEGSKTTVEKHLAGKITNYFEKLGVASALLEAREVNKGNNFMITGPTTGVMKGTIEEIHADDGEVETGKKKQEISFKVPGKVRKGDKFFIIIEEK